MATDEDVGRGPVGEVEAVLPLLWAKLSTAGFHPLLCHLLDVAAVAEALWDRALAPAVHAEVATALGLTAADARCWVALWVGLHDLGKASPCFARKDATAIARLAAAGVPIAVAEAPYDEPHGTISTVALRSGLVDEFGLAGKVARRAATVVGGHHGTFPGAPARKQAERAGGGPVWAAIRRELIRQVAAALEMTTAERPNALPDATAIWLAGFVSTADWIGSIEDFFPPLAVDGRYPAVDPLTYLGEARDRAATALDRLGWAAPKANAPRDFGDLFPELTPNSMQRTVIELGERLAGPCLVVVEAETGSGKSEAALWLANRWGAGGRTGLYVALPTRATSDQMFGRVRRFLGRRYADETVNFQLLHGLAGLSAEFGELRRLADRRLDPDAAVNLYAPTGIAGPDGDDADANVVAAEWFTHRKRGLLAPFGIGTIDQSLLAVLQTRHHFVRLSGLAGKTVVFDEVHAYDTYMSTLLEQLLRWLAALGTSVVLLSATLPAARRDALVAAYRDGLDAPSPAAAARQPTPALPAADQGMPYPRVSWVERSGAGVVAIPRPADVAARRVTIEWVDGSLPPEPGTPFPLGERLRAALADGGCAAVICNTVGRAQAVYRALTHVFPDDAVVVDGGDGGAERELLHARFRFRDREEREHRALARFGKPGGEVVVPGGPRRPVRRPWRAVLVATQVIEQSLDLDFDLIVTDLAPLDLILQRMGRLHRHLREHRPTGLDKPRLWICRPDETDGAPRFDEGSEFVYAPHVLLRSWLALRRLAPAERGVIAVPDDVERLIEEVYDDARACPVDASPALRTRWAKTRADLDHRRGIDQGKAEELLVLAPGFGDQIFEDRNRQLREDDPSVHRDLQALTRLAAPSVDVVCLTPAERARLLPKGRPTVAQAVTLLRHAVPIGNRHVYHDLKALPVPAGWQGSALLRHHRLLLLDESGRCRVGNRAILRNNEATGIEIEIEPAGR